MVDITSSDDTAITTMDAIKTILSGGTGTIKEIVAQGNWKDNDTWRNIVGLKIASNEVKGVYWDATNAYTLYAVVSLTPSDTDNLSIVDNVYTL